MPHNELTPNVSARRRCVTQGTDGRQDAVSMMEDLQLEVAELKQQQKADHAHTMGVRTDLEEHKTKTRVIEIKLCELEKEGQKRKDKNIEDTQAHESAIGGKSESYDADFLHLR
ncbi:hypothetical protein FPANT_434 [Fusarium pseudoanthophilum]|uniref:Uncharacterized protein n=1 Tax=Fusarium pseudoanthophilum TaxID=48495 RepID=A0A8H5V553_9HYPO|nr:hypothetical protein FPANT_434 [Fusarium pseudoanthophilum]